MRAPLFPRLADLQGLVWRLITAPEGVGKGAADLHRRGALASEDLSFLVAPDARPGPVERLGPAERLDVYADMYFYRLRDCLAEDFPKLASWIGTSSWHNLVTDYLLAHPSTHFSLRELGRALPGFLETHELARRFPAIADLAQLEWARVDVFDEIDATPLSGEDLLAPSAADPETSGLALVPATRLLQLPPSVLPLWRRLDRGERAGAETPQAADGSSGALVWRLGFAVLHRSLPRDEERCLRVLAEGGTSLARLGELLLESQLPDTDPARAAERLAGLLARWARDGLLRQAEPDA